MTVEEAREWTGRALTRSLGIKLRDSVLWVLECGRIGQTGDRRALAVGMRALHHARRPDAPAMSAGDLVDCSRFQTSSASTWRLQPTLADLSEMEFALAKPAACLVNTARSGINDERPLPRALTDGRVKTAGLDVYFTASDVAAELLSSPRHVSMPHIDKATRSTRRRTAEVACESARAVLHSDHPETSSTDGGGRMTIHPSHDTVWGDIQHRHVKLGTIAIWWLYQAGLVLKNSDGAIIAIDPYLSNASLRSYAVARAVPAPLEAAGTAFDAVLASHSHPDHLDPDSINGFARHESTVFIGPPLAMEKVLQAGVTKGRTHRLRRGEEMSIGDFRITAVYARHPAPSEPVPDAIGYVIESDGVRIYHSGDTVYDAEILRDVQNPSCAFIAMNGTDGNMNVDEAAFLAWRQRAVLAVPFHYGLWKDADYGEGATLDPRRFLDIYRRLSPVGQAHLLKPACPLIIAAVGQVDE